MRKIYLLIFTLIIILIGTYNISAVTFPDTINCDESGLVTNHTLTVYKKYCKVNNQNIKGFCTKFIRDAASGYDCKKINWNADANENTAISYAVGHIIAGYNVGSYDSNYTLAESAINKLLYKLTNDKKTYNDYYISIINNTTKEKYENIIHQAFAIYDGRKNGKDYTSGRLNKIWIDNTQMTIGNKLEVTVKCYNQYSKGSCVSPTVVATIGNVKYDLSMESNDASTTGAGTAKFILDLTSIRKGYSKDQMITINLKANQTLNFYKAQNYDCGKYQSIAPNVVEKVSETQEATDSITVNGTKKDDKLSCQNLVNRAYNTYKLDDNKTKYYQTLLEIYKASANTNITSLSDVCSDCEANKFGEILNLESPSCTETLNVNSKLSCDGVDAVNKFIYKDQNQNPYYCKVSFKLDTSEKIGSNYNFDSGSLLYYSDNGIIGEGVISYECQMAENQSINIPINNLPVLNLSVGEETSASFISTAYDAFGNKVNSVTLDGSNPKATLNVKYSYPQTFNYSLLKGTSIKFTNNCENGSCLPFGYGFKTSSNTKKGTSTLSIKSNSSFINLEDETNCNYQGNTFKFKLGSNLLYRGIDDSMPFLTIDGKERLTGSNWCDNGLEDDSKGMDITDNKITSSEGIDIRNIYMATDLNEFRPIFDLNDNGYLDHLDGLIFQASASKRDIGFSKNLNIDYDSDYSGSDNYTIDEWEDKHNDFVNNLKSGVCYQNCISSDDYQIYIREDMDAKYDFDNDGLISIKDSSYLNIVLYEFYIAAIDKGNTKPPYSLIEIKIGDVNLDGSVNGTDYESLRKFMLNQQSLNIVQKYYADCARDGYLNNEDLVCIQNVYNKTSSSDADKEVLDDPIEIMGDESEGILRTDKKEGTIASMCYSNNNTVTKYIKESPNSSGIVKTTIGGTTQSKKVEPIYSFTLTPSTIKKRLEYNDTQEYNDFNLTCTDGYKCISKFITNLSSKEYGDVKAKGICLSNRTDFCEVIK